MCNIHFYEYMREFDYYYEWLNLLFTLARSIRFGFVFVAGITAIET